MPQKSTSPTPSAKNDSGEYATFENALKKVLTVSYEEMKAKLNSEQKEKRPRKQQPKQPSSAHASHDKD
jgi:hypothetical protein